jgi:hypothetical protein
MGSKVTVWVEVEVVRTNWIRTDAETMEEAVKQVASQGHKTTGEASFQEDGHICAFNRIMDGHCIVCGSEEQ